MLICPVNGLAIQEYMHILPVFFGVAHLIKCNAKEYCGFRSFFR
jgi:hypothetical protein